MKKFILSTVLLSAMVLGGCVATTPTEEVDKNVATYTDGEITETEFYDRMKGSYGEATLQQMLIEEVLAGKYGSEVTDETVKVAFDEEKTFYESEEAFADALEQSGYTEDTYKDIIRYSMLMEATVTASTELTAEEIKTAYDAYVAPVTASHILVTEEALAKDLIAQLEDGADFALLAKENSEDTGTAENGGELTFTAGEMVPEFEEAAFALKEGETTKEPVASDYGFHIIKMTEKTEKGTLEEETETIKTSLMTAKLADTEYVAEIVAEVLKDAGIEITDKDLSTAMDIYLNPVKEEAALEESATEEVVETEGESATSETEEVIEEAVEESTEDVEVDESSADSAVSSEKEE